jgi:outer membrane protein insertion porin family
MRRALDLILGGNLSENNFLGTGKQVGVGINRSTYQSSLNFSFSEPYFTVDGVSVGYNLYVRETDYDRINVASFSTNTYGGGVNWSYPISDVQRIGLGIGYENLDLKTGSFASREISDFVEGNGNNFDVFSFNINWAKSTLNRGIFATRGTSQRLSLDLALPGSGLEYYKVNYNAEYLRGLTRSLTLKLKADLGYGESYGDTTQLPFFKNFTAVVLARCAALSAILWALRILPVTCRSPLCYRYIDDPDPIGGNVKVELGAEVIFPLPFLKDQRSVQSSLFLDAGNIFNTKCGETQVNCFKPDAGELRYAFGVGATWLSGFGPITFSVAKPLNSNDFDETEVFQFSLGNQF